MTTRRWLFGAQTPILPDQLVVVMKRNRFCIIESDSEPRSLDLALSLRFVSEQ